MTPILRIIRTRGKRGWVYYLQFTWGPLWWRRYTRRQAPVEAKAKES